MSKESNTETIKLSPEEVANIKANRKNRELERVHEKLSRTGLEKFI